MPLEPGGIFNNYNRQNLLASKINRVFYLTAG